MLSENTLREVVNEAIVKYAVINNGIKGWTKADIEESIYRLGGTKEDLYRAMVFGMEACFGDELDGEGFLN